MKTTTAWCAALAVASLATLDANATESGGSTYPMGAENYMSVAMPPAGMSTILFANHYGADELKNGMTQARAFSSR